MAALLVVLMVAPTFDEFVCLNDQPATSAQAEVDPASEAQPDPAGATHAPDGGDICAHGHCHHGVPFVTTTVKSLIAVVETMGQARPGEVAALVSQTPNGPERPPRG